MANDESTVATVARVLPYDFEVVINRGAEHGVRMSQRYLIYGVEDEPLKDPVTGETLGLLELVRGTGRVVHVQPRIATIRSDRTEREGTTRVHKRKTTIGELMGQPPQEYVETSPPTAVPFQDVSVENKTKRIE